MKTKFYPHRIFRNAVLLLLIAAFPLLSFAETKEDSWKPLFDGKSLQGWSVSEFGGSGDVRVEDGMIHFEMGFALTGVTYTNEVPKMNYEISLEARKLQGNDFFAGLTFPVGDSHCSLISGGWGGGVVGISSIDGMDASENETTQYMRFDTEKWYRIRVRVTEPKLEAWIDDVQVVDLPLEDDRKIDVRPGEIELSKPLGIAAWQTQSQLRNIKIREIKKAQQAGPP